MSWETRSSGGRYYTRSIRRNGRVVREYLGTGELAEIFAEDDKLQREIRNAEAMQLTQERKRDQQIDQLLDLLGDHVDCLSKGVLIASGYHQHKRSEWRKRSGS
jgi:hypothetical protein